MGVEPGYRQTETGVIPEDWDVKLLRDIGQFDVDNLQTSTRPDYEFNYISIEDIDEGKLVGYTQIPYRSAPSRARRKIKQYDVLISTVRPNLKAHLYVREDLRDFVCSTGFSVLRSDIDNYDPEYVYYHLFGSVLNHQIDSLLAGSNYPAVNRSDVRKLLVPVPRNREEQTAIAEALSDADALISALEQLIAKKRDIKKGAMQLLLAGKKRLPGFSGEWDVKQLGEVVDCLDNLRSPLNESQRAMNPGDIPYCGANGILDYIGDHMIDDDIILIAEDGGYFDEYAYRPIAYRMSGKCWVNNHAHILKAKENVSQDFVFYALVHKNVLMYLAGGTRAKLNKREMYRIEIQIPRDRMEQTAVGQLLGAMDSEIEWLERKLEKYRLIKQGMMQELLTGKKRLI